MKPASADAYAAELFAILANPRPTGLDPDDPYGQADDGIDRYDGFGSEVVVTAVVPTSGEVGEELEVSYELLEGADWKPGVVRVPHEAEWLRLSRFESPSDYAPEVARRVVGSIGVRPWSERREALDLTGLPTREDQGGCCCACWRRRARSRSSPRTGSAYARRRARR